MMASGSCKGAGAEEAGRFRPRRPSGDDCVDPVRGLAVEEGPFGVTVDAGVTVNGTEVMMFGLGVDWAGNDGGCQHLWSSAFAGAAAVEVIAAGAMVTRVGQMSGSLATGARTVVVSCQ